MALSSQTPSGEPTDLTVAFEPVFDVTDGDVLAQIAHVRRCDGLPMEDCAPGETHAAERDALHHKTIMQCAAYLGVTDTIVMPVHASDADLATGLQNVVWAAEAADVPLDLVAVTLVPLPNGSIPAAGSSLCRDLGLRPALTGLGGAGLALTELAENLPDIVFLDAQIVAGVDTDPTRRTILRSLIYMCENLGLRLVAGGIAAEADMNRLQNMGIRYMHGPYLARPELGGIRRVPDTAIVPLDSGDAFRFGLSA